MRRIFLLIFIMLGCMGSVLIGKTSPTQKLNDNLISWEQFHWQGIIQVQSSAFTMRKYFVISKNKDAIRLDILDSGIMGLNAKPLVSLYLKDSIVLDAPAVKQLEGMDPNWFIPKATLQRFIHFSDSLFAMQQEIVSSLSAKSGDTVFTFDKKYRLISAKNPAVGFETKIVYNRRNKPDKLIIKYLGKPLAELQITDREYGDIDVEPVILNQDNNAPQIPQTDSLE